MENSNHFEDVSPNKTYGFPFFSGGGGGSFVSCVIKNQPVDASKKIQLINSGSLLFSTSMQGFTPHLEQR